MSEEILHKFTTADKTDNTVPRSIKDKGISSQGKSLDQHASMFQIPSYWGFKHLL